MLQVVIDVGSERLHTRDSLARGVTCPVGNVVGDVAVEDAVDAGVEVITIADTASGVSPARAADALTAVGDSSTPSLAGAAGATAVQTSISPLHSAHAPITHAASAAKRSLPPACASGPVCGPAAVSAHHPSSSSNPWRPNLSVTALRKPQDALRVVAMPSVAVSVRYDKIQNLYLYTIKSKPMLANKFISMSSSIDEQSNKFMFVFQIFTWAD